jgi:hypothetical protein
MRTSKSNPALIGGGPKAEGGKVSAFVLNAKQLKTINQFKEKGKVLDGNVAEFLPLAIEVKAIFAAKPRGAKIEGCSEFYEFVEKVFKKAARTVRHWLADSGQTDPRFANKPKLLRAPAETSVTRGTKTFERDKASSSGNGVPDNSSPWRTETKTATAILPDVVRLRKNVFGLIPLIDEAIENFCDDAEPTPESHEACIRLAEELSTMSNSLRDRADKLEQVLTQMVETA